MTLDKSFDLLGAHVFCKIRLTLELHDYSSHLIEKSRQRVLESDRGPYMKLEGTPIRLEWLRLSLPRGQGMAKRALEGSSFPRRVLREYTD